MAPPSALAPFALLSLNVQLITFGALFASLYMPAPLEVAPFAVLLLNMQLVMFGAL
jgi:hypothetical protein